jgi:tRNA nucleotidyltransferase (CCA-adding enzyme)
VIDTGTFAERHRRVLDTAKAWGAARQQPVWLVGGPVRDALLGRRSADVDLAVDRGALDLATHLSDRLGGHAVEHREFLTAAALLAGGDVVDVVTTRRESYPSPGALPLVHPGTIEDDLLRRDFSINAIGYELGSGEIVDPSGGRADLAAGVVRVLHDRSFVDDPTRIFRALRLASRLALLVEESTGWRLREAIEGGALRTVSRERLWRELRLAMSEERAADALQALASAGALDALLGAVRRAERNERLRRVESLRAQPRLDAEILFLDALLAPEAVGEEVLPGSGLSSHRKAILRALRDADAIAGTIAAAGGRLERMARLDHAPAELLAVLRFDERAAAAAEDQARCRETPLPFRGDAIGIEQGPHVGAALRDTRRAIALGTVHPDEALAFARSRALEYLRSR